MSFGHYCRSGHSSLPQNAVLRNIVAFDLINAATNG
jgi:hypothetical protein